MESVVLGQKLMWPRSPGSADQRCWLPHRMRSHLFGSVVSVAHNVAQSDAQQSALHKGQMTCHTSIDKHCNLAHGQLSPSKTEVNKSTLAKKTMEFWICSGARPHYGKVQIAHTSHIKTSGPGLLQ